MQQYTLVCKMPQAALFVFKNIEYTFLNNLLGKGYSIANIIKPNLNSWPRQLRGNQVAGLEKRPENLEVSEQITLHQYYEKG